MDTVDIETLAKKVKDNIQQVIVGKEDVIDQMLVALLASRHVLLEDVPGTGKTLLAKTLAASLDCTYKRVQFTPDLLPTDVTGLTIYRPQTGEFDFQPGPVFTNVLLADEINRATPRTQSSLLESMEEHQVTIDGKTHVLEQPFFVIATQNPIESQGTFPLPEAQLDRFFLKINIGYPSKDEGVKILKRFKKTTPLLDLAPVIDQVELVKAQKQFTDIEVTEPLYQYIIEIVEQSRKHEDVEIGISPRGSQALLRAAQAYAAIKGRNYVIPDDVKAMAVGVLSHRLVLNPMASRAQNGKEKVIKSLLKQVHVPTENKEEL
ncbi:MoxR-like ATPase [Natronobacillus azotifigens]|uniref:MoxR family ATPase n=1 Tax=Natronobacillus azotifigens TaxID=472978 RepID=A0A9J6R7Y9_9BACI|nr:MoxR family ATPase [Natronobacillus azotifigens]MCZ0701762.1 MoxR family ATPase [Natronobacillus azotifigens]